MKIRFSFYVLLSFYIIKYKEKIDFSLKDANQFKLLYDRPDIIRDKFRYNRYREVFWEREYPKKYEKRIKECIFLGILYAIADKHIPWMPVSSCNYITKYYYYKYKKQKNND